MPFVNFFPLLAGHTPRALCLAVAATFALPFTASAQQDTATPAALSAQSPEQLGAVVVTGTRSSRRTVAASESPIDILTEKDLTSTGSTELATVLSRLVPSMNFPRPSVADASDAVRPAQLRGLSPDQTLVLVNGKRRHSTAVVNVNGSSGRGSAPVDLNAIPVDAIDHVEVLRDGAAAQYGSDAIAGVVNFILKKNAPGGSAHVDFGQYDRGDGQQYTAAGNTGFALGEGGFVRLALEQRHQNHTNRAGADFRDADEPRYGQVNQRMGDPDSEQQSLLVNSQLALTEQIELYAVGSYSRRHTSAAATWRTAYLPLPNPVPTPPPLRELRSPLYPEGFLPLQDSHSTDQSIVVGLRGGDPIGWRWDLSVNHGSNDFDLDIENTANLSLGAASPTAFSAGALKNAQTVVNLDVVRDLDWGLANPVTLAVGAELRRDQYDIEAGEQGSYSGSGAQGFTGFRPQNAGSNSRRSQALYIDIETEFSKRLSGGLAVRREHDSDFGNATSAKLSGRFSATDAVAFRATASTGFRAPSLAQQHYTITTTNFIVVDGVSQPLETGTFAVGSAAAHALGATPLKAEKSRNLSLGLLLQPIRRLSVTADAYQIDIDDRVLFSSNLVLPAALRDQLVASGVLASAARYFTNGVDTRTRGIDVVATYRLDAGSAGRSEFTAAYNHNRNTIRGVAANPALLTAHGLTLIDAQTLGRATVASPESKLALSADHTLGRWNLRAGATRYGSFVAPQNNAALSQTYDAAWVLDVSGQVKVERWTFSAGIDNLNNRYPDEVTSAGNLNTNGIFKYSNFSPFGFNGRYYYLKAGYAW